MYKPKRNKKSYCNNSLNFSPFYYTRECNKSWCRVFITTIWYEKNFWVRTLVNSICIKSLMFSHLPGILIGIVYNGNKVSVIFFFSIQARIDLNKHVKYYDKMLFSCSHYIPSFMPFSNWNKILQGICSLFSYIKLALIQAEDLQIFNLPGFLFLWGNNK